MIVYKGDKKMSCIWTLELDSQRDKIGKQLHFQLKMSNVFGTTEINQTYWRLQEGNCTVTLRMPIQLILFVLQKVHTAPLRVRHM